LVIDGTKAPIPGAKVEPITPSMTLAVEITDGSGIVVLPRPPQRIEWVSVTKDGFEPSGQIQVSTGGQTTIILRRSK
jgi:hypothetical protein